MAKLYVGNLPFTTTEQDLRGFFQGYTIARIKLIADRETGKAKGFGFVEIEDGKDAQEAISVLNGTELGGRKILVDEAVEKQARPAAEAKRRGS